MTKRSAKAKDIIEFEPAKAELEPISAPLEVGAEILAKALETRSQSRKVFIDWIMHALVRGVDYGQIHFVKKDKCGLGMNCPNAMHWSKPSMWKPGAEKITGMLGLKPLWPMLQAYEEKAIRGEPIQQIILRCTLVGRDNQIVAEGMGARSVSDSDLNKAIKMAKKSGHIDSVLTLGGLSEVFTQDLEDEIERDQAEIDVPKITTDQRTVLSDIAWEHFEKMGQRDEDTLTQKTEATLTGLAHSMGVKSGKIEDLAAIKFEDAKQILSSALDAKRKQKGK